MKSKKPESKFVRIAKKVWKDSVGSKIISIGLIALIPLIYGLIKDIPYGQVWEKIYNIEIRLFYVVLVLIIGYFINRQLKRSRKKLEELKTNAIIKPTYVEDVFGANKTKWAWDYSWDSRMNHWAIVRLTPLCSDCGTKTDIVERFDGFKAECSKCRLDGNGYVDSLKEYLEDVEKEIIRRYDKILEKG